MSEVLIILEYIRIKIWCRTCKVFHKICIEFGKKLTSTFPLQLSGTVLEVRLEGAASRGGTASTELPSSSAVAGSSDSEETIKFISSSYSTNLREILLRSVIYSRSSHSNTITWHRPTTPAPASVRPRRQMSFSVTFLGSSPSESVLLAATAAAAVSLANRTSSEGNSCSRS